MGASWLTLLLSLALAAGPSSSSASTSARISSGVGTATGSFATLDPAPAPASVTASGTYAPYVPTLAFDTDPETFWHSDGPLPVWLAWEYSTPRALGRLDLTVRAATLDRSPNSLTVESSPDGSTWATVQTFQDLTGWTASARTFDLPASEPAAHWRIRITATNAGDQYQALSTVRPFLADAEPDPDPSPSPSPSPSTPGSDPSPTPTVTVTETPAPAAVVRLDPSQWQPMLAALGLLTLLGAASLVSAWGRG